MRRFKDLLKSNPRKPIFFDLGPYEVVFSEDKLLVKENERPVLRINKYGVGYSNIYGINCREDTYFKQNWLEILKKGLIRAINLKEAAKILPFPIFEEFEIGEMYLIDFFKDFHPYIPNQKQDSKVFEPLEFLPQQKDPADVYDKLLETLIESTKICFDLVSFGVKDEEKGWTIFKDKKLKVAFVNFNGDVFLNGKYCPNGNIFNGYLFQEIYDL